MGGAGRRSAPHREDRADLQTDQGPLSEVAARDRPQGARPLRRRTARLSARRRAAAGAAGAAGEGHPRNPLPAG